MSDREPKDQRRNDDIAARARESFAHAVDSLDVASANRLRLLRREALASRASPARSWLLPATAAAAGVLALSLAWRTSTGPTAPAPAPAPVVSEDESPLPFPSEDEATLYAWLGEAPVATPGGETL